MLVSDPTQPPQARALVLPPMIAVGAAALFTLAALIGGAEDPADAAALGALLSVLCAVAALIEPATLSRRGGAFWLGAGSLAALAAWTLASAAWSDADGRAAVAYVYVFVYVAAFLVGAVAVREMRDVRRLLQALTAGMALVCALGLGSRLLPWLVPVPADTFIARLSFPVDYWNALGLIAGAGCVACLTLSADAEAERRWRMAGAALLPLCGATLYFTFSRGALLMTVLGAACLVAARPTLAMRAALVAALPVAAVAAACLAAPAVSSNMPRTTEAQIEGGLLAIVTVMAGWAGAWLRGRSAGSEAGWLSGAPRSLLRLAAGLMVIAGIAALIAGAFAPPRGGPRQDDNRDRLVNLSGQARGELWRVAADEFRGSPLHGGGAGSFATHWKIERHEPQNVDYAHNRYLETLAELGVVGLVLTLIPLGAAVVGARRGFRDDRTVCAGALALLSVWLGAMLVDYHWQVPAASVWAWLLAGALAGVGLRGPPVRSGRWAPALLAAALAIALVPVASVGISQLGMNRWRSAVTATDLDAAQRWADLARRAAPYRSGPYQLLARMGLARRDWAEAERNATEAIERDPDNAEVWLLRAAVKTRAESESAGADFARATALDPLGVRPVAARFFPQVARSYLLLVPETTRLR